MSEQPTSEQQQPLGRALNQLVEALQILDELKAPGDIGSHLDLAISRLEQLLGFGGHAPASLDDLLAQLSEVPPGTDGELGDVKSPWEINRV